MLTVLNTLSAGCNVYRSLQWVWASRGRRWDENAECIWMFVPCKSWELIDVLMGDWAPTGDYKAGMLATMGARSCLNSDFLRVNCSSLVGMGWSPRNSFHLWQAGGCLEIRNFIDVTNATASVVYTWIKLHALPESVLLYSYEMRDVTRIKRTCWWHPLLFLCCLCSSRWNLEIREGMISLITTSEQLS